MNSSVEACLPPSTSDQPDLEAENHGAEPFDVEQTPLIHGINDDVAVLRELFQKLSFIGTPPYYVFHCRPTEGNEAFSIPIEDGYRIFLEAQGGTSGLAARARYCMSHVSGKLEVAAMTDDHIVFRYQRAADPANRGRSVVCERNPEAQWFDDYPESEAFRPEAAAPVVTSELVEIGV